MVVDRLSRIQVIILVRSDSPIKDGEIPEVKYGHRRNNLTTPSGLTSHDWSGIYRARDDARGSQRPRRPSV